MSEGRGGDQSLRPLASRLIAAKEKEETLMAIYPNAIFKARGWLLFWLGLPGLLVLMATTWASHAPATPVIPLAPRPVVAPDFGQLPLSFIPNAGQTDQAVRFQAHGYGGTLFFTPAEVTLVLPPTSDHRPPAAKQPAVVSLRFVGANPAPEIVPAPVAYPAQIRCGYYGLN